MHPHDIPLRQRWMRALALSPEAGLEALLSPHLEALAAPRWLRKAETGLVMLRARAGGTGAQFNLGEVSVTRASVALADQVGHAYVQGSSARHAELAAQADALLQDPARHKDVLAGVIVPLEQAISQRREQASRAAASSKVEFFTMVRGD